MSPEKEKTTTLHVFPPQTSGEDDVPFLMKGMVNHGGDETSGKGCCIVAPETWWSPRQVEVLLLFFLTKIDDFESPFR